MKKGKRKSNLNFRQTKRERSASRSNTGFSLFNRLGSYFKRRV